MCDRAISSEIDNDVYCVCTHDISLCTHTKFRHVHTMYAVKFSGTQTVFGFMRAQLKYLSENRDKTIFFTNLIWLLCQQSNSSYNNNVAFDRSLLHIMQYNVSSVIIT